jgi:hypothetical protein
MRKASVNVTAGFKQRHVEKWLAFSIEKTVVLFWMRKASVDMTGQTIKKRHIEK